MTPFKRLEMAVSGIGGFLLFVSTILAATNAICRYGLRVSLSWADEVCVFSIVISVFLMQMRLEANREQLSIAIIDPLLEKYPLFKTIVFWIHAVLLVSLWTIFVSVGLDVIKMNYDISTVTSLLMFPMWIIYAAYTLGMALIIVAWIYLIQKKVRGRLA